ncbi:M43 family zinc metalloprotease [Hymenobacter endophyticus]|uniref:M43 family zinc metalloprotease n=1 Tax=Hymenobacter endophyticus TaxID=3076335 RepID=A0ABU3TFA8_9BACT|nr:M43 family zinc metalloprotease [Hymenobacter endophyticus]MDU0370025.1 M43 family zinc metalloprotease [Hymenobacter endophyticus]
MGKKLLLSLFWVLAFSCLYSVPVGAQARRSAGICGFDSLQQILFRRNPGSEQAYRAFLQQSNELAQQTSFRNATAARTPPDITVPVVVHIIHTGTANNITDAQVLDAIRIANEDYSKTNSDTADVIPAFRAIHANIGFRFRLAQRDPSGNCTTGITRTYSTQTLVGDNNVKNLIRWDPNRYLNVWVCENANGSGGYAYLPCTGSYGLDGIVVRNAQFGSIGTSANRPERARRTFTHEIAHYFGVPHTWGNSNTAGLPSNCGIDDGILDTPNTIGSSTTVCDLADAPCGVLANVQNHMDYAQCTKMFTLGQRAVMRNSLNLSCRSQLVSVANLQFTGTNDGYQSGPCPPVAQLSASTQVFCAGGTTRFTDFTSVSPDAAYQRRWVFVGGEPATSTEAAPTVRYSTPGLYPVSLSVTTAAGTSTTTRLQFIQVLSAASVRPLPLQESFENPAFMENNTAWQLTSSAGAPTPTWERQTTATPSHGQASLVVRNADIPAGTGSYLHVPALDVAALAGPLTMQFDYAYARRTAVASEALSVTFSTDCGANWSYPLTLSTEELNTQGSKLLPAFAPASAADWRTYSLALPAAFVQAGDAFRIRLYALSGGGNSLYLDNFRLSGTITPNRAAIERSVRVFPNPATHETTVAFQLPVTARVQIQVVDMLGRPLSSLPSTTYGAGLHQVPLPNAHHLSPGVYVVQLRLNNDVFQSRLLVQ